MSSFGFLPPHICFVGKPEIAGNQAVEIRVCDNKISADAQGTSGVHFTIYIYRNK